MNSCSASKDRAVKPRQEASTAIRDSYGEPNAAQGREPNAAYGEQTTVSKP